MSTRSRSARAGALLAALAAACGLATAAAPASAQADAAADRAIRDALSKWTDDFNARYPRRICDLFASDLVYDYRGFPERGYADLCNLLKRSLADPSRRFAYTLDIREIIVSGDIAIVRLVWTLRISRDGSAEVTETREPGLDVFRREADGAWRIARYMAYEAP